MKNPILAKPRCAKLKWLVDYAAIGDTIIKISRCRAPEFPADRFARASKDTRTSSTRQGQGAAVQGRPPERLQGHDRYAQHPTVQGITEAGIKRSAGRHRTRDPAGDGKQTLTKYAPAPRHHVGQWAPTTGSASNADTFARNPNNADDAKSKPLAWRNAWDIPRTDQAVRRCGARARTAPSAPRCTEIQAEFRKSSPFVMLLQQTEVAAYRSKMSAA